MKYILMFLISMLTVPNIALSSGTTEIPALEEYDIYTDFEYKDYVDVELNLGDPYPPRDFRCEIFIVVIDLGNDYGRTNHRVSGNGQSWSDSRQSAFNNYRQWINDNRFWQNRFNHSFRYRNCFQR